MSLNRPHAENGPAAANTANRRPLTNILRYLFVAIALFATAAVTSAQTVDFEGYSLGTPNGQNGWSKTGPFDMNVSNTTFPGFGTKSLRISNAITSGSFGDQAFSPSNNNEAGETAAVNGGMSGGTRQNYFESQFSIGTTTNSQQLGLLMSNSPDRGDGARMSYLRFEDFADGIHVYFADYQDAAPFGTTVTAAPNDGCGVEDDFTDIDIATLSRGTAHTIKYAIFFMDGQRNDIVQIYIDGVLVHTGTTWEDYFRFCEGNQPRTVDSLLFRTSGIARPEHSGNGFLIDNMNAATSTNALPTMVVDDDGLASLMDCNATDPSFTNIQTAVTAADPGDTIRICPGTYAPGSTITLNKAGLTLLGIGTKPLIQAPAAPANVFHVTANNVTIDNLEIAKPVAAGSQALIWFQGNNFIGRNNLIYGPDPGTPWSVNGIVSQAFLGSPGANNVALTGNTVRHLRQPAYIDNATGGVISGNSVSGSRGWVVAQGAYAFSTNTFGEPQNQGCDIALLSLVDPSGYPTRLAMSTANDNARICAQYPFGEDGRAISYVNSAALSGGNGSDNANYNTIADGITGTLIGGQVVAAGTFAEPVSVTKSVTLKGSFTNSGTLAAATGSTISPGLSPGIINSGSVSMVAGSNFNVELNGTTPGTGHDQLNVTGTVSLGGANLNVTTGFVPSAGNTFVIINNDGADAVTGTFNSLPQGATVFAGGYTFTISYTGGSNNNDVVLTAVFNCNAVSIPTNITTLTSPATVNVPVNVDDTTGNGLFSTDFTLTYNNLVISAPVVSLGTATAGGELTVNTSTPGVIVVSIFSTTPFAGSGTIANIQFSVPGLPGTSSPVSFGAFKFNEGTCSTTSNGLVTVASGTITGTVRYGNVIGTPVAPRYIPDVTLSAVGSVNTSANTGPAPTSVGFYTLSGMGAGGYTVTPSKVGGVIPFPGNTITSFDAGLIAREVVGLPDLGGPVTYQPFNATQNTVADVSGTGGMTSFDAALIARWAAGLSGFGNTAQWRFTSTDMPFGSSRTYPNVNTNQINQDYTALLMGDTSGNYAQTLSPARPGPVNDEEAIEAKAPIIRTQSGRTVSVPLTVGDTTDRRILSYQFELKYDPDVLEPQVDPVDLGGSISEGFVATVNAEEKGRIVVVVFGSRPFEGKGTLATVRFNTIGAAGSTSTLEWSNFLFNEGDVTFRTIDGSVTVDRGDKDVISGRVVTQTGDPIKNTRVMAVDLNGNQRTVVTDANGYFEFAGLKSGETYVVRVDSKQHRFAPQTVSLTSEVAELQIIAQN